MEKKKISGLAVASFLVSLLIILPGISGLAAMIIGAVALHRIGSNKETLRGTEFAAVGITLGALQLCFLLLLLLIIPVVLSFSMANTELSIAGIMGRYNDNRGAIRVYERMLKRIGKSRDFSAGAVEAIAYQNLGTAYYLEKDYARSRDAYEKAAEWADKMKGNAYYGLAGTLRQDAKLEESLNLLDKAIGLNPKLVLAYQEKAALLRQMGRIEDSLKACEETNARFPDFAQAYSTKGLALERLNRWPEAIRSHCRAISLNPRRFYPRDRLYYCLMQVQDPAARQDLLREIRIVDENYARELSRKLEAGEPPEKDLSVDFEKKVSQLPVTRYMPEPVLTGKRIAIREPVELDFKSREEVLELRSRCVYEEQDLVTNEYVPSDAVFGGIEDKKPWWGLVGHSYYGDGPRSIEGASEESRFIVNPYLLVGITERYAHRLHNSALPARALYPRPRDLIWEVRKGKARVTYDISGFWSEMKTYYGQNDNGILSLTAYNARDLGYGYLYVDVAESKNIESFNRSGLPLAIPFMLHCGGSCGYPGGCNNASPNAPDFAFRVARLPALVSVKLWKEQPENAKKMPDMAFTIYLE